MTGRCSPGWGRSAGGDYARALLAFATQGERFMFSRAFGQKQAEERIVAIMKYKKLTAAGLVLALVLVCGVTAALATSPPAEPDTPEETVVVTEDDTQSLDPQQQELLDVAQGQDDLAEDTGDGDMLYEDVLTEGYHYLTAEEYTQEMDAFFAVVKDGADQEYYDSLYAWAQFTLEAIRSGRVKIGVSDFQANDSEYVYLTVLGDRYTREMPTDDTTELFAGRWTYRVGPEPTTKEAAMEGFHEATPEEYEQMIELYELELAFMVANGKYTQADANQFLADCAYTLDLIRSGTAGVMIKDYWVDTIGHMIFYSPD